MDNSTLEREITLVKQLGANKSLLIPLINYENDKRLAEIKNGNEAVWLPQLMNLAVTKLSQFRSDKWDYNEDVPNPPRSVVGAKLRLNFSNYSSIPPYVMTELKCLCHLAVVVPMAFKKKVKGKRSKAVIKPNTIIANFKAGLRFINSIFKDLGSLGAEYVNENFQSLTDILDSDFRKTAEQYEFTVGQELKSFLGYLNHPFSKNVLNTEINVDLSTLKWPEQVKKEREERLIFENDDFEKLINHSTFTVVDFLCKTSQEVEDNAALSHYEALNEGRQLAFTFNEELLNDYVLIRLLTKGYSKNIIESKCKISNEFLNPDGSLMLHEGIRKLVKEKYNIDHFDNVRKYINEVYYSCAYLISQLTAMRPSEMSEIVLSKCLVDDDGFDLIVSNVKKDDFENLNLFDDKWVAIPIMKDAVKAANLISTLKNNDYLFSNMDTVAPDKTETNMSPYGIKYFFDNFFGGVLGEAKTVAIKFNAYMIRHTLAHQLNRVELGLPFISFQLKHIVNTVDKYTSFGSTSKTTLGYGEIAERIVLDKTQNKKIRRYAEVERIKTVMDPDGIYAGPKAKEHKARIKKVFQGYMEAGYSKEEVFDAMAEQGLAVINVGTGFCFGGMEDFDEAIPCIGSLRCNPIRCSNAIVGKANAPKWREVYVSNKELLNKEGYKDRREQIVAAIEEAKGVLLYLGEAVG